MQNAKKVPRLTLIDALMCLKTLTLRKTQKVEICQFYDFFEAKVVKLKAVKLSSF